MNKFWALPEKKEELAKIDLAVKDELDREMYPLKEDKEKYVKAFKKLMQLKEESRKRLT